MAPRRSATEKVRAEGIDGVTVIVPTRNESENIGTFLASLPEKVRLIVIDSSLDDTAKRIAQLRPDHTTIVLADVNIPQARQIGADLAVTPWLLFTDADVELSPHYSRSLSRLQVGPDVGGIVGTKGTAGGYEGYHRWFRRGQQGLDLIGIPAATGSNMLVRTEALTTVGGFDPDLSVNEDTELMFRIRRAGYDVQLATELEVHAFDPRRQESGRALTSFHSSSRCEILWAAPRSKLVRRGDWGYWRRLAS